MRRFGYVAHAMAAGRNSGRRTRDLRRPSRRDAEEQLLPTSGIYTSQGSESGRLILGYPANDQNNDGPLCHTKVYAEYVYDIAVDRKGNLMVPDDGGALFVVRGPRMCGTQVIQSGIDGVGAHDAASLDALNGKVALATVGDSGGSYSGFGLEVCTLSGSYYNCTSTPMMPLADDSEGVAMNARGDCWLSGGLAGSESEPGLWYFKGCGSRTGVLAKGWVNRSAGGLDIDRNGNLVSIDPAGPSLYVYRGCDPKCRKIGGPYALHGQVRWGHLNEAGARFATADYTMSEIDIYEYQPKRLTYLYSITNGIGFGFGVAYTPGR